MLKREEGFEAIRDAIGVEGGFLPAPAEVEFTMVAAGAALTEKGRLLLAAFRESGLLTIEFSSAHSAIAATAYEYYGKGNGKGGPLNLLDLMVYAVAKERGEPLLCTGKDFAATDLMLHSASRAW